MDKKLNRNYQLLIEESLESGAAVIRNNGDEMRGEPRFQVNDGRLSVRVEPTYEIIDVSASGMAFFSDIPFKPGTVITLYLEDTTGVQARVIGCYLVETDADFMEAQYRVQCHFENEEHGKQVMLMLSAVNKLKI